jgi:hypothetical protein
LISKPHPEGEMRHNVDSVPLKDWIVGKGDGFKHLVDMGNPVIKLSYNDLQNRVKTDLYKAHLTNLIYFEQKNIVNRDLGLRVFMEVKGNEPGAHMVRTGMSFGPHPNLDPDRVVSELFPGLVSLLIKLKEDGREPEWKALKSFLRFAPPSRLNSTLYQADPDLFDYLSPQEGK